MSSLRLRLKYENQSAVETVEANATVGSFLDLVAAKFSLPRNSIALKFGFPPQDIPLVNSDVPLSTLVSSGQQILVLKNAATSFSTNEPAKPPIPNAATKPTFPPQTEISNPPAVSHQSKNTSQDPPYVSTPIGDIALRVMPDDNSCLFRALSKPLGFSPYELREIVANQVLSNPDIYSTAILGKPSIEYASWIRKETSWGGYIELSILSSHFGVEICSVDVKTGRVDSYNPQPATGQRTYIVYSGIHYDLAALAAVLWDTDVDVVLFDASDVTIIPYVQQLASLLKNMHYYTDTASFSIRCTICGTGLVGEKDATAHALATGHTQFGEY